MRTTRRSLLTGLGATAFAGEALANPAGQAPSGPDRGGGGFDSENTLDRIPLIFGNGQRFAARYLMLVTLTKVYFYLTLNAVFQRNENRLPLASLPLLNQVFRATYSRADFEILRRIAIYYLIGSTMLIDLRPRGRVEPVANASTDWDKTEAKLAADAQRPVQGQIMIEAELTELSGPAETVSVFNQDSSYTMLLGGNPVGETLRQEVLPFLSNLPLMGQTFTNGTVTRKDNQLLVMISPSIVERSWN